MRCFFRVEYDGSCYCGWQSQVKEISIQQKLEQAFSTVTQKKCSVVGAGRTDAGVHARAQGVHIDLPDSTDLYRCLLSVNSVLPRDIAIYNLVRTRDDFHARYSAVRRRYIYRITERKRPLQRSQSWFVSYTLDWERMCHEASTLVGRHDFTSFCASGHSNNTMDCTVYKAEFGAEDWYRTFTIEANRFLYKMVRSLVGTLVDMGRGQISDSLMDIINSRDRTTAGRTAPASGLVLEDVIYPEESI